MWTYLRQLDGLRAVAVLLVVLYHAGLATVAGGYVGVDVFFVLSGFLVSGVILGEVDRTGTLRLGGFYARRVRRLLPAALVVVVATAGVWVLIANRVVRLPLVGDAQSALLYVANWRFLVQSNDYFAIGDAPSPFLHFWSLSIEEQFYVVFPAVLLLVVRRARRPVRTLALVVAVVGALSVAAQLVWAQVDANHAYYGTDARLYQLLAGVLLTLVLRRHRSRQGVPAPPPYAAGAAWAGAVVLVVTASGLVHLDPTWRGLLATAASVALIGGVATTEGLPTRLLSLPAAVYLGQISYGLYLWHWPVLLALRTFLDVRSIVLAALGFALSAGLAALSYQLLERPVRRAKPLDPLRWRVVLVGLTASAVLAAFVLPPALHSARIPATVAADTHRARVVDTSDLGARPVPADIDFDDVARTGEPHTCPADQPQRCTLVHGRGPHLLLVGDSIAEMFVPTLTRLAREEGFTFSANVVSGCWWATGPANRKVSADLKQRCRDARGSWYDRALPRLKPDVVLLVQRPREGEEWTQPGTDLDAAARDKLAVSARTSRATLDALSKGPWKVLVLHTVVAPRTFKVNQCLASARTVGECAVTVPPGAPVMDSVYDSVAATNDDVWTTTINDLVCPAGPTCLPIRDGTVVWRDQRHLTLAYLAKIRDQVWRRLTASGAMTAFGS